GLEQRPDERQRAPVDRVHEGPADGVVQVPVGYQRRIVHGSAKRRQIACLKRGGDPVELFRFGAAFFFALFPSHGLYFAPSLRTVVTFRIVPALLERSGGVSPRRGP